MLCRLAIALTLLMVAGCGSGPATAPVSGRITLDGKPLSEAQVAFQPIPSGNSAIVGVGSFATTDADGRYTLQLAEGDRAGAIVGKHRVRIHPKILVEKPNLDGGTYIIKDKVPAIYNTESTLTAEVPVAGLTNCDFALKSK